jgi:hypothetical protein
VSVLQLAGFSPDRSTMKSKACCCPKFGQAAVHQAEVLSFVVLSQLWDFESETLLSTPPKIQVWGAAQTSRARSADGIFKSCQSFECLSP